VQWLGQLRVVKLRNTLGAKGYMVFIQFIFFWVHITLYAGKTKKKKKKKKKGKGNICLKAFDYLQHLFSLIGECSNYEYLSVALFC
jgi:hypothetical protein